MAEPSEPPKPPKPSPSPSEPSKPSSLLSDPTFLAFFYHHVVAAAHNALDETGLWTHFQVEGITMVGGAVMAIYAPPSNTSDIDLTWYLHANPAYPSSQPQAVERLGDAMHACLREQLAHPFMVSHVQQLLGASSADGFEITCHNRVATYGSYALLIRWQGGAFADLTLHDGFGSQSYDHEHRPIPYPRGMPMIHDPMYSSEQCIVTVVKGIWPIRIPTVEIYAAQQLFAGGNLLLAGKEKGYRLVERVVELIRVKYSAVLISLLLEKLMMLQKWPGLAARMDRLKPMLQTITPQLERWNRSAGPMCTSVSPHVPFPYSR